MTGQLFGKSKNDQSNPHSRSEKDPQHALPKGGDDLTSISTSIYAEGRDIEKSGQVEMIPPMKSEAEKRLVRKIAFTVIPFIMWIAVMQYADKSALSVSAVLGLYPDLNLTGIQFSWLSSIFFIGHLVCQPINNIMLQKLPVGSITGIFVILWGAVMFASGYCRNFSQLLAMRFLLGLFEGRSLPSMYLIVNTLFRRSEQATYYGVTNIGNGLGIFFCAIIGYGVSQMGNQRGITMWRWNHIILGVITMLLGVLCTFLLVDNPKSRLLRLTEEEVEIVNERTKDNAVVRHHKLKWSQMLEALTEVRFWCICFATFGISLQNGGLPAFSVLIYSALGDFTPGESILFKIPAGAFMVIGIMLATFLSQRTRQLCYSAIITSLFSLVGSILLAAAEQNVARLIGIYLTTFWNGSYSIMTAIIGTNVYGYSKKIFYNGALVFCFTIGNFVGPLIMLEREAPRYITAMIVFSIGNGVAIACFLIMRFVMASTNKDRISNPATEPADVTLDLTDKQDRSVIYRL